ncbi:MAG TPA: ATP-binding protein [Gemmatimonadaceae bacterium]
MSPLDRLARMATALLRRFGGGAGLRDEADRLRADLARLEERIREVAAERSRQEETLRRVEAELSAEDARARHAERLATVGATLASAAHELNNPLSAIRGFAQLLLAGERSAEDRAALETIERESRRASRVVKDLLAFSRPKVAGERQRVGLNAIVTHIAATRRYAMQARGIECHVHLDPALPAVMGDGEQLEQLLLNLVVNAEEAVAAELDGRPVAPLVALAGPAGDGPDAPSPARIAIGTRLVGDVAELHVEDSGLGLSAECIERIWEPFFTTKEGSGGTGIGLAIARSVAISHGGSIVVESEPRRRTRFTVRLPACGDDAPARAAGEATYCGRAARPLDILAADDDRGLLDFVTAFLSGRGHTVLCAGDGAEALRLAERLRFDVVLCDYGMPEVNGAELIERMRARGAEGTRFVIATSSSSQREVRERIDRASPHALVRKPFELEELRRAVETG